MLNVGPSSHFLVEDHKVFLTMGFIPSSNKNALLSVAVLVILSMAAGDSKTTLEKERKNVVLISLPLIPYNNTPPSSRRIQRRYRGQRRRRLDDDGFLLKSDPLYQGYGTHYVDLWVGTPPQRQTLIVDTGSAVTAFPCSSECSGCGRGYHTDTPFVEKRSSTFKVVPCSACLLGRCSHGSKKCERSVSYQEGSSWHAHEAQDEVYSGGPHYKAVENNKGQFQLHFACQTELTGLFKTQLADGIMGMEMSRQAFWHQAHDAGVLANQKFSLCFGRKPEAKRDGTNAGILTMGGADRRLHETPMVYAKQLNTEGWYVVSLKKIHLRTRGGDRVVSSNKKSDHVVQVDISDSLLGSEKIIVDSGTTDTYLPSDLAKPFSKAWKQLTGRDFDNGSHRYHDDELLALPTVLFQLAGEDLNNGDLPGLAGDLDKDNPSDVLVAMPHSHFMEYNGRTKKYKNRLYFTQPKDGVLGANFIMGHDVLFDIDNGRLGFAESACDYKTVATKDETPGRL